MNSWAWARRAACFDRLARGVGVRVGDVLGDGLREQERIVADDRDGLAQRAQVHLAHVGAVEQHAPGARRHTAARSTRRGWSCRSRWRRRARSCARPARRGRRRSAPPARRGRARRRSVGARRCCGRLVRSDARRRVRRAELVGFVIAQRDALQLHVPVARRAAAGAPGGAVRRGGRSRTWKRRAPEAVARWARLRITPSVRIGAISMFRYR